MLLNRNQDSIIVTDKTENFCAINFLTINDISEDFLRLYSKRILKMSGLKDHQIKEKAEFYISDLKNKKKTSNIDTGTLNNT